MTEWVPPLKGFHRQEDKFNRFPSPANPKWKRKRVKLLLDGANSVTARHIAWFLFLPQLSHANYSPLFSAGSKYSARLSRLLHFIRHQDTRQRSTFPHKQTPHQDVINPHLAFKSKYRTPGKGRIPLPIYLHAPPSPFWQHLLSRYSA